MSHMTDEVRKAGDAYRMEMGRLAQAELEATEILQLELPKQGPISLNALERYAREAGVPLEHWLQDALAWAAKFHTDSQDAIIRDTYGDPEEKEPSARVPAWRARLGEYAYRVGDALTEPEGE